MGRSFAVDGIFERKDQHNELSVKEIVRIIAFVAFLSFVVGGLTAHLCATCYPDHPFLAKITEAVLFNGGM